MASLISDLNCDKLVSNGPKKECVTIMVPVQPVDDDAKIGTRPKITSVWFDYTVATTSSSNKINGYFFTSSSYLCHNTWKFSNVLGHIKLS